MADVILGTFLLKRKYPLLQIGAVFAVSMGITAAAIETRKAKISNISDDFEGDEELISMTSFVIGCVCIVLALFLRAGSGIAQELIFKETKGTAQEELLVWRSAIGLPILCLMKWSSIVEHSYIWSTYEYRVELPIIGLEVSLLYIFMFCNLVFDYSTKILVGELIYRTSALSTSLVLILMRFVSIVFSSCYVNATSTPGLRMWAGCLLVVSGTWVYTTCELEKKKKKKKGA